MKPLGLNKLIEKSGKTPEQFIIDLLNQYGSIAAASRAIKVSRQTLYNRCEAYGIDMGKVRVKREFSIKD
jgi:DNA invertase Pin-like site-specific DNA recombinase